MKLRDYQRDVLKRWQASPHPAALVVLPTGAGKTHVAVAAIVDALRAGARVLVVVHRREIARQVAARLIDSGVPAREIGARVEIRAPAKQKFLPDADLVVVDEAHRSAAPSYRRLLARYPRARVMGLTATPWRLDGKGLGDVYREIIEGPPAEALISAGHLARPRCYTVPEEKFAAMIRGVRKVAGDYARRDLAKAWNRAELTGDIVRDWTEKARDLPTIVFAVSVEHSRAIERRFRAAGVSVAHVDGKTSAKERERIVSGLRDGSIRVVVNCEILCEGFDAPNVRCVVLARPTLSRVLYLQQVGRAMRPGDVAPIVLDHAGNVPVHGLPEMHREWSLDDAPKGAKRAGGDLWRCGSCGLVFAAGGTCPDCGRDTERMSPAERGGALVLAEWVPKFVGGVTPNTFGARLRMGWDPQQAATTPVRPLSRPALALAEGVTPKMFRDRVKQGWDPSIAASRQKVPRSERVLAAREALERGRAQMSEDEKDTARSKARDVLARNRARMSEEEKRAARSKARASQHEAWRAKSIEQRKVATEPARSALARLRSGGGGAS